MKLFLSKYRLMETSAVTMELESQRAIEQIRILFFSTDAQNFLSAILPTEPASPSTL